MEHKLKVEQQKPLFKIGDKVRLVKVDSHDIRGGLSVGDVGVIIQDDGSNCPSVKFEDTGYTSYIYERQFEVIQPDEEPILEVGENPSCTTDFREDISSAAMSNHYDLTYTVGGETIRIDPYFVAMVWKLGKKDDTGVLFHCLKTIARFGEKNSEEREIIALHKQVKRFAELRGVVLEQCKGESNGKETS